MATKEPDPTPGPYQTSTWTGRGDEKGAEWEDRDEPRGIYTPVDERQPDVPDAVPTDQPPAEEKSPTKTSGTSTKSP